MKFPFFLYLKKPDNYRSKYGVRVTKEQQATDKNEIVVQMTVDVPDALFERPQLSASITIPSDVVPAKISAETVDNIKEALSQAIDFKINFEVEDINKIIQEEDPLLND